MSEPDKHRAQQDARRRQGLDRPVRYTEAVIRYLGAVGYRPAEPSRAVAANGPATAATTSTVGGVVLVGVDETPTSYTAVDHAAIEAELRGWALRLLHVQHPGGLHQCTPEAGARLLARLTDRVHAYSPSVVVTSRLEVGAAS